jgi:hypothetical protein
MYYFSQASRELKTAVIWFGAWTQNCSNLVWCFCRRLCRWWAEGDEEQANVELAGSRSSSLVYTLSFGPLRESVKIRGCKTAGEREEGSCDRWGRGCRASRRRRAKWAEESESNPSEGRDHRAGLLLFFLRSISNPRRRRACSVHGRSSANRNLHRNFNFQRCPLGATTMAVGEAEATMAVGVMEADQTMAS